MNYYRSTAGAYAITSAERIVTIERDFRGYWNTRMFVGVPLAQWAWEPVELDVILTDVGPYLPFSHFHPREMLE